MLAGYPGVVLGSAVFGPLVEQSRASNCAARGGYEEIWVGLHACPVFPVEQLLGAFSIYSLVTAVVVGAVFLVVGLIAWQAGVSDQDAGEHA